MERQSLLEALREQAPPKGAAVHLPVCGRGVFVRNLFAGEALAMHAAMRALEGEPAHIAKERSAIALHFYLCDEEGNQELKTLEEARELLVLLRVKDAETIIRAGNMLNAVAEGAA